MCVACLLPLPQLYQEASVPTSSFVGVPVFQAEGLTVTTQDMVRHPAATAPVSACACPHSTPTGAAALWIVECMLLAHLPPPAALSRTVCSCAVNRKLMLVTGWCLAALRQEVQISRHSSKSLGACKWPLPVVRCWCVLACNLRYSAAS